MTIFIFNFLLGLFGLLAHIVVKFFESNQKSNVTSEWIEYIKGNKKRLIIAGLSYLAVFSIALMSLYQVPFIPQPIIALFKALELENLSFSWVVLGYLSDSIIRNITKIFLQIMTQFNSIIDGKK